MKNFYLLAQLITVLIVIAAIVLLATFFLDKRRKSAENDCKDNLCRAYAAGWVKGASVISKMQNDGSYDYDKVLLIHFKDSVEFSELVK